MASGLFAATLRREAAALGATALANCTVDVNLTLAALANATASFAVTTPPPSAAPSLPRSGDDDDDDETRFILRILVICALAVVVPSVSIWALCHGYTAAQDTYYSIVVPAEKY